MHILVPDLDEWWAHVQAGDLAARCGVLWRIGQNIPGWKPV